MYTALALIKTKDDLNTFRAEIDLLKDSLFEKQKNLDYTLANSVRSSVSQAIKTDLSSASLSPENYFNGLLAELDQLKILQLTLAFEPPPKSITRLSDWVAANLGPGLILDLQFDPTILGGALIAYQGKYHDYSLKSALDRDFSTNQKAIIDLVKNEKV